MINKRNVLALLFAAGLAVGLMLGDVFRTPGASLADPQREAELKRELDELQEYAGKLERLFQAVAEIASPSVVYIATEQTIKVRRRRHPFENDPFFRRFFEDERFLGPREREFKRPGVGSGFIIDKEGHVLTNNHVVTGADKVEVRLADGRTFRAKTVGSDLRTDIAVIKLEGELGELPVAKLGDSEKVAVGQWVIAIGNPFGLKHTVSAGIVSAKGRSFAVATSKESIYERMVQTDAAINPGNSGGPLVNLRGEVIGINAAIVGTTYQGVGFAIPINMVKDILEPLKAGKKVVRGYLGVGGKDVPRDLAKQWGYEGTEGAFVNEVMPDTPAQRAGLKDGDIIVEWNGKKIKDWSHLRQLVAGTAPGDTVEVKVWREGKVIARKVGVASLTPDVGWLRLEVEALSEEKAERLGRPGLKGVEVVEVAEDSPARAAISPGDIILSVARRKIASVEDYRKAVAATTAKRGTSIQFLDVDRGFKQFIYVRGE